MGHVSEQKATDRDVLLAVAWLTERHGFPPTIREICAHVGLNSPATMHRKLRRLRRQGHLTWDEGHVRTIRVVELP